MAEKGSPKKKSKKPAKWSLNVKKFAYDVLGFSVAVFDVPEAKIRIRMDIENDYSIMNYLIRVYAAILSISLSSRDKWKRMFESRFKSSGLDSKEKIEKYLSTIVDVLPEFQTGDSDKILVSLALYSEIILFLNFKNIEFHFEQFLDMWCSYFTEKIALNKNTNELLDSLCFDHDNITAYLNLLRQFIKDAAIPYGARDVSMRFEEFSQVLEEFALAKISIAEELRERVVNRLGFMPHNPLPDVPQESVSLLSSVIERDTVLPGDRDSSPETPRRSLGFRSPSSGTTGVEDMLGNLNIDSQSPRRVKPTNRRKK